MKSPLEKLSELEEIINIIGKIDTKMVAGQIIPAYRELKSLEAKLIKVKIQIIEENKQNYQ